VDLQIGRYRTGTRSHWTWTQHICNSLVECYTCVLADIHCCPSLLRRRLDLSALQQSHTSARRFASVTTFHYTLRRTDPTPSAKTSPSTITCLLLATFLRTPNNPQFPKIITVQPCINHNPVLYAMSTRAAINFSQYASFFPAPPWPICM